MIQFLLIGAAIYAAYALFGADDGRDSTRTILVNDARIQNLATTWERRWNRPPTEAELAGLVRSWLREEVLYREARAMGLDEDDHVVRRRLAQKLEFLSSDIARIREPSDAELLAYFEEHEERFRAPDRVSFVHVYFNPDGRGDALRGQAEDALARLRDAGEPDGVVIEEGDRFLLPTRFVEASARDIGRAMGSDFAAAVMRLEPGRWHGPVSSGFGLHLVYVADSIPAPEPVFADVRERVREEWQRAQAERFDRELVESLKNRYDITIEAPGPFVDRVLAPGDVVPAVAIPDGMPGP